MQVPIVKWEPWEDYKEDSALLPIFAPPCPNCKFWKPQRRYVELGEYGLKFDGIVCCHAKEQHCDFSCYRDK
jgi:hypothetical protein